jgi:hypothetical protein
MTQQRKIWPPIGAAQPLPTAYRGCRFRSRLEARWAVFFDHMGIGWQYEPQGYLIGGRPYLPDFLLECGTWVEVKGSEQELDKRLLRAAALQLPVMPPSRERGPKLLILGPIPLPPPNPDDGDWTWLGLDPADEPGFDNEPMLDVIGERWGFGLFPKNRRPWAEGVETDLDRIPWLTPILDSWSCSLPPAYAAAAGARFEHGERGR